MMSGLPDWRNPKLNVKGTLFDYKIWNMQRMVGWPAESGLKLTRKDAEFEDYDYLQLDIGGEGYQESGGIESGFNSAINVNAQKISSQLPMANIPHLILVQNWMTNPLYPFADAFADYMTMQCAPLTPTNISEFKRCIRPGGEIGLWIWDEAKDAIQALADRLHTYVEWNSWSEFGLGDTSFKKKMIPVPGADYMIGFSMGKHWFFISSVTASGKLGPETDRATWRLDYNALATFKIRGQTYLFGWSNNQNYWFISEILPGGKIGRETANGKFNYKYEIMTTAAIGGKTYLIGHSRQNKYLFINELLEDGRLGGDFWTTINFNYDQVVPFTRDGQTYLFLFNSRKDEWFVFNHIYEWEIVRLLALGRGWQQTDCGKWYNPYDLIVVNVQGNPILFGQNQSTYNWFLQRINEGGKLGQETDSGRWENPYKTISTYTHGKSAYLFGQNDRRYCFISEVYANGKLGPTTYDRFWNYAYENVRFYTQYM